MDPSIYCQTDLPLIISFPPLASEEKLAFLIVSSENLFANKGVYWLKSSNCHFSEMCVQYYCKIGIELPHFVPFKTFPVDFFSSWAGSSFISGCVSCLYYTKAASLLSPVPLKCLS